MFLHRHPYPPFIPENATKLIVGTLPPPRFSTGELKAGDVDFCYGSRDGQLWRILDEIFNLGLVFETTRHAVAQRKDFLAQRGIGICDIVESAERLQKESSDIGMKNIQLRNVLHYLKEYPAITTLLFTGGNSLNGPEYLFKRHLKERQISWKSISNEIPRIHQFQWQGRIVTTVSLTSPSGSANRAVGSLPLFKKLKKENTNFNSFDFRVLQYRLFF